MKAPTEYHPLSKAFHWLLVAMLAVQFTIGWVMPGIRRNMTPSELVSFHMAFGITILAVMLLRFIWRLIYAVPDPEPDMPHWQEQAARTVHYLLYAIIIALPLTGWWLASANGWSVSVFGISIPAIVAPSQSMEHLADFAHVGAVVIAAIIIGAHVLAALYHYFVLRDDVLQRMLPGKSA